MTLPNVFTLIRIFLMPIFVVVFFLPVGWAHVTCALIFMFAAFTDFIDGYLARKLQQTSAFGEFFDPVADKLIVSIALVLLVGKHANPLLTIPAVLIVCRELIVSALREWMAELGKRTSVAVSQLGKLKAVAQMGAIILLLLSTKKDPMDSWIVVTGYSMLYLAAVLTIWSMLLYLRAAWPSLDLKQNSTRHCE